MGIKNLHKFLRNNCPDVYHTIHLSQLAYQKVAIDISLYMFKYKTIFENQWLDAFIKLISCLRKNEIHCVFIYDTGAPPEKMNEREERAARRQKLIDKIQDIENDLDAYFQNGEVSEKIQKIYDRQNAGKLKRLLSSNSGFDVQVVETYLEKVRKQVVSINKSDFPLTRVLFDFLGIPFFDAKCEAETTCAHLCLSGKVEAVLSEDTDVLAYGTETFLTKINTSEETCVVIHLPEVLNALELTYEQFRDLCIMCGNDYNKNIPRVGCETSYKLLREHENIEGIGENTKYDISILNHKRSRELFTLDKDLDWEIPFCKSPDWSKVSTFLFENNCRVHIEYIKRCFAAREMVFED
jgi:flap endonuclease-1